MKAPDKIYIQQDMINNLILEEKEYADDVEYIRKNLVDDMLKTTEDHAYFAGKEKLREELLKWLEEMKFYSDDNRKIAYQNVIDKLHKL